MKNFIEIEDACNHFWVTTKEIMIILGGVSKNTADKFRCELEEKLDSERISAELILDENTKNQALSRCFYFKDTRPHKLPVTRVLEEAHIDLDFIRKQANMMRDSLMNSTIKKENA